MVEGRPPIAEALSRASLVRWRMSGEGGSEAKE